MATFEPGRIVRSRKPHVTVENSLEPGVWRFELVVVDDDGIESAPAKLAVTVTRRGRLPLDDVIGRPPVDIVTRSPRPPIDVITRPPRRPIDPDPDPDPDPQRPFRPLQPRRPGGPQ